MTQSRYASQLCKLLSLVVAVSLSACTAPEGIRYKMTDTAPATDSLQQAYTDLFDEWWKDSVDVISADRLRHGFPQKIDPVPPVASNDVAAYDHYQPMYFKVYAVQVVDEYKMPVSLNYNEHLEVMPNDAVREWAQHLRPTGGVNKLQVVIKDARMVPSPTEPGRYNASLALEMRICSRDGTVLSSVSSSVTSSGSVTDSNRKAVLNAMLSHMVDHANGDLESKMASNFGPYMDRPVFKLASN